MADDVLSVQETWDILCLLVMIRINYHHQLIMNKRRIPCLDDYLDRINLTLWPRFKVPAPSSQSWTAMSIPVLFRLSALLCPLSPLLLPPLSALLLSSISALLLPPLSSLCLPHLSTCLFPPRGPFSLLFPIISFLLCQLFLLLLFWLFFFLCFLRLCCIVIGAERS